jgi:pimeloyl-ACP methyl ester carboxylesterase
MTVDGYITTEDGVRLFLEKSGTGPTTLVILNGFLYLDDFKYLGSQHALVSVDVRNRGRSDLLSDPSKLERGIHQDVDDLETVRQYLGLSRFHLLAHSYAGMTAMLYALKYRPTSIGSCKSARYRRTLPSNIPQSCRILTRRCANFSARRRNWKNKGDWKRQLNSAKNSGRFCASFTSPIHQTRTKSNGSAVISKLN